MYLTDWLEKYREEGIYMILSWILLSLPNNVRGSGLLWVTDFENLCHYAGQISILWSMLGELWSVYTYSLSMGISHVNFSDF